MKKLTCVIIAIFLLITVLTGCTSQPVSTNTTKPTTTNTTATQVVPQSGGTLVIIGGVGATNMGVPYLPGGGPDQIFSAPFVETLLRLDKDGLPVPWLATAWELSPDKTTLTFTLRQGVKFHDGTDFNATAVKYLLDKFRTGVQPQLKSVSSIDIIDDYKVRLNLSKFETSLILSFAERPGNMVSPTSIQNLGEDASKIKPVGTGPFVLADYKPGALMKGLKFDKYWQKGKPYLDGIDQITVADTTVATMNFRSGQAQVISTDAETAHQLAQGNYVVVSTPAWVSGIIPDSTNADSPFSKLEVRQAISYAIDNITIAKSLGYEYWEGVSQLATKANWYYSKDVVGYPYNPAKAKELLAQAGYPNGFNASVTYTSTVAFAGVLPIVQDSLKKIGIQLELKPTTQPNMINSRNKGWTNGFVQWDLPARVGADFGSSLVSNLSGKGGTYISTAFPADVDALILQSLVEPDQNKRKAIYDQISKLAIDKYCMVNPIVSTRLIAAKVPQVKDLRMTEFWYAQWTPEDAWLSK